MNVSYHDEMQQQKYLQILGKGNRLGTLTLLIVIAVQILLGADLTQIIGEVIAMSVMCVFNLFGFVQNGLVGSNKLPSTGSLAMLSLIFSVFVAVVCGISRMRRFQIPGDAVAYGLMVFVISFIIMFIAVLLLMKVLIKRHNKLEEE